MRKRLLAMSAVAAMCIMTACSSLSANSIESLLSGSSSSVSVSVETENEDDTDIDLSECTSITISGEGATVSGDGASYEDGIISITSAGEYLIEGEGSVSVCVAAGEEDNVTLIFDGVNITSDEAAPVYVEEAKNVYLVLKGENTITDTREEVSSDDEKNIYNAGGAIYSTCDLFFEGSGSLTVVSDNNDGIKCKDDVKIKSGNISVQAADEGIDGNDSFTMEEGTLTVKAGDKGIKINDTITIDGGTLNITADDEGMQALDIVINDGDINIDARDDGINISDGSGSSGDEMMFQGQGGFGGMKRSNTLIEDEAAVEAETANTEDSNEIITKAPGGRPDGNGPMGREDNFQGGPMGEQGNFGQMPEDMEEGERPELPEGMEEGEMPEFQHGQMGQGGPMNQEDEDFAGRPDNMDNAGGEIGFGMMQGDMGMDAEIDGALYINGGNIYINAYGDGIDSNGSIYIAGGYIEISGPENSGNGSLDYNGECEMSGGTLIMTGSSGMIQNVGQNSEVLTASTIINGNYDSSDTIEIYIDGNKTYTINDLKKGNYISVTDPSINSSSTVTAVIGTESYTLKVQ